MAKLVNCKYFSVLSKSPCSNRCIRVKNFPHIIDLFNQEDGYIRTTDDTDFFKSVESCALNELTRSLNEPPRASLIQKNQIGLNSTKISCITKTKVPLAGEPTLPQNQVIALRNDISDKWNQTHKPDRSTPQDPSYVAAVLEYNFAANTSTNLDNYQLFIAEAANQSVDIMVFPEMTLTVGNNDSVRVPLHDLVPEYPTPALHPDLYDEVLVRMSESSRLHQMYVVINVQEVMQCGGAAAAREFCPDNITYYFNTNVVFDRNGSIISRYRKINLFGEIGRSPALKPEPGVFDTDFGVKFGHFICFDLLFEVPAVQIRNQVRDVIFPTMWFSELPYLTAVQIQEAYAYKWQVNLLASGANRVSVGSTGSGIYSGEGGALASVMAGKPTTQLLVSRVPKVPERSDRYRHPGMYPEPTYNPPEELAGLFVKVDPSLADARSQLLQDGLNQVDIFEGATFCGFRVNVTHGTAQTRYRYRVAAFDGVRTFDNVASGGKRSCAVLACTTDDVTFCGSRFPVYNNDSFATFTELSIIADFPKPVFNSSTHSYNSVYYSVSVTSNIMPLSSDQYTFRVTELPGDTKSLNYHALVRPRSDLYAFGVWGRVFATDDGQEPGPSGNSAFSAFTNVFLSLLRDFISHVIMLPNYLV